MTNSTDITLFERLRHGTDPVSWEEFFHRYWRLIFANARRFGCSDHTAEEMVQELMARLFEKREVFRFDPAQGAFRSWLATVVRNLVAERRRGPADRVRALGGDGDPARFEAEADHPLPEAIAEAAFEESLLPVLLDVVRGEFDPQWFQAFELTALRDFSGKEVAEMTGMSRNAVYKARSEVLARLRELGAPYRDAGRLGERIRQALNASPEPAIEIALSTRVENTLRGRRESSL